MGGAEKPSQVFCHLTGRQEDAETHLERFCRFYANQPPKASLGNSVCHDSCTVPKRFEVPGSDRGDAEQED
jgi:hypothetical protein